MNCGPFFGRISLPMGTVVVEICAFPGLLWISRALRLAGGANLVLLAELLSVSVGAVHCGVSLARRTTPLAAVVPGQILVSLLLWSILSPVFEEVRLAGVLRIHLFALALAISTGSIGHLCGTALKGRAYAFGAAMLIISALSTAILWGNLLIDGVREPKLLLRFVIDSNPAIVGASLLGYDPIRAGKLYDLSEAAFYRFRYPGLGISIPEQICSGAIAIGISHLIGALYRNRGRAFI